MKFLSPPLHRFRPWWQVVATEREAVVFILPLTGVCVSFECVPTSDWNIPQNSSGSRGRRRRASPSRPKRLNSHAVFRKKNFPWNKVDVYLPPTLCGKALTSRCIGKWLEIVSSASWLWQEYPTLLAFLLQQWWIHDFSKEAPNPMYCHSLSPIKLKDFWRIEGGQLKLFCVDPASYWLNWRVEYPLYSEKKR